MRLPSATAGPGMSCERCGRESRGAKDSHFSFCADCRLFVCDRCWDSAGMACEGCVGKRKAEATAAAFLAASEAKTIAPPAVEPIREPMPEPLAMLPESRQAREAVAPPTDPANPTRGPNGRFLPRASMTKGSHANGHARPKPAKAAPSAKAKPAAKANAAAKADPSVKAKPAAAAAKAAAAPPKRGAKGAGAKPLPRRSATSPHAPAPVPAVAFSVPPAASTPPAPPATGMEAEPMAATATPVATLAPPVSPSSEAFRASILNSIGTPDVAWQVMARPGMPAPTRVPVGPARPVAPAPRPVRRTVRDRLPAAGRLARGVAIRLAMALILAVAALVAIAAAMTLTGAEAGAGAPSAPAAADRNAGAAPATQHPGLSAARSYVIQRGDTLRTLARRFYGNEGLWPVLFEANRKRLAAPEDLRIGTEIIVPTR